ncbi:MAG: hypothetical protein AB1390_09975 [Nitrospirota bacterium]
MIRLICPSCRKDSYTACVESFRPCPYCGTSFSGKYGIEKRNEYRVKKKYLSLFFIKGASLKLAHSTFPKVD